MNGACNVKLFGPGALGRGQKVKYHLISNNFFFKHGHVVYQINGDDEQNRMQVKLSS